MFIPNVKVGTYPSSSTNNLPNSVWFQVTVITVPIAGSIVLVILIFMATKVLRQDTKRQRQISEIRKQRQFKTHLLLNSGLDAKQHNNQINQESSVGNNISSLIRPEKNQTNAKINDLEKGCDISTSSPSNGTNLYNIINLSYKDSNITNTDHSIGDKDSLFVKPLNNSIYNSLLSCGK